MTGMMSDLLFRMRALFRRKSVEAELDEELRAHFEHQVEKLVKSGLPPEEAKRQARLEFGGLDQVKEECRDARGVNFIETLIHDIHYGLRMLRKTPGFTTIAILTLALGIGANTAIFGLVNAVMLRLLPVEKPEELQQVWKRDARRGGETSDSFTNPLWEQLRDRQDVFSSIFAWGEDKFDLARGGAVHYAQGIWVSGDFFKTLGLRPTTGRLILASDDRRGCAGVAVLSYGFWQGHYGDSESAVGSTLSLSRHPIEVIGVAPRGFHGLDVGQTFDVALPICAAAMFDGKDSRLDERGWWWLDVMGRRKPGTSVAQLEARLAVLSPAIFGAALPQKWAPEFQRDFLKRSLVALSAPSGVSGMRRQFDRPLQILMAVVGLVLLIACANIASLMLARASARYQEIALRQALGASRRRLMRQLLTECIMLSSAGALVGILFARWGAALLVRYLSTTQYAVFLDLSLDGRVLAFTAAIAVLTGILFGVLPAFRSTRISLTSAIKGGRALGSEHPSRFHIRQWIVATQVALSLVLLVAAGLLLRSFHKLVTLDVGFDRNNVLLVSANLKLAQIPPDRQLATFEAIENRLSSLPGIESAGRSLLTPIGYSTWNQTISTDWSKALTGDGALAWLNAVSPGYFKTLGMPLLAGRNFNSADTRSAPPVAIVNQTLARRFFPTLNPLGRTFRIDPISGQPGPPIEVVGLVRDAKYESIREDTLPTAFFPASQVPGGFEAETFELRSGVPPSALISPAQAAVADVNKEIPLEFHTLAQEVNDSMVPERLLALLSGFFGALALLLAMIGIYGTFNYQVSQRHREFGVRMALGAAPGAILRLVLRDLAVMLACGLVAGISISLASTRVLQRFLFGLDPYDAVTLIAAAGLLSAVAILAGYLPARRATKVDPMVALRYE